MTINGAVTVTSTAGLTFGNGTPDSIQFANSGTNSLTFNDTGISNIVTLNDDITNNGGTGTVSYDGTSTNYQVSGDNTYAAGHDEYISQYSSRCDGA